MRLGNWKYSGLFFCLGLIAAELQSTDLRLMEAVKSRDAKAFDLLMAKHADINAIATEGIPTEKILRSRNEQQPR